MFTKCPKLVRISQPINSPNRIIFRGHVSSHLKSMINDLRTNFVVEDRTEVKNNDNV